MRPNRILSALLGLMAWGGIAAADEPACGSGPPRPKEPAAKARTAEPATTATGRVTVEFFVMSQCPFAVQVEEAIAPVLARFGAAVDFRLEFVGLERDGELASLHGPNEVAGDKVQACAQAIAPDKLMELTGCMNRAYRSIPTGWDGCAQDLGLDVDKISECVEGELGDGLLKASFARTRDRGVKGSPTIFIGGQAYRGTRSELGFGRAICEAAGASRPAACTDLPVPPVVPVVLLYDPRCPDCREDLWRSRVTDLVPGSQLEEIAYTSPAGRDLFEKLQIDRLPALVFGSQVERADEYDRIRRFLKPVGDRRVMLLGRWNPTLEICDNGVDDTGDGQIDCADPACQGSLVCRPEESGKLEVYVMSQCPYAVRALNAMRAVFGQLGNGLRFEIHYIADTTGDGFRALHGQPEVDENIRQLCAAKLYAEGNRYLDYIWCRNPDIRSAEWQDCALGNGFDVAAFKRCAEGPEGKRLLGADLKLAQGAGIQASPTWLVNNRHKFNGINPEQIVRGFCAHNPQVAGCVPAEAPPEENP